MDKSQRIARSNGILVGMLAGCCYGIFIGMAIQQRMEREKQARAELSRRLYALERKEWDAAMSTSQAANTEGKAA